MDIAFMELALQQAKFALDSLEVPVGCVIIEDGQVIASGRNRTNETRNATRHAEMEAIDTLLEQWQQKELSQVYKRWSTVALMTNLEGVDQFCLCTRVALSSLLVMGHGNGWALNALEGYWQQKRFQCFEPFMSKAIQMLQNRTDHWCKEYKENKLAPNKDRKTW